MAAGAETVFRDYKSQSGKKYLNYATGCFKLTKNYVQRKEHMFLLYPRRPSEFFFQNSINLPFPKKNEIKILKLIQKS